MKSKRGKKSTSEACSPTEEKVSYGTANSRKPRSRSQNDLDEYFVGKLKCLAINSANNIDDRNNKIDKRNRSNSVDCQTLVFKKKSFKGEGLYEVRGITTLWLDVDLRVMML